MPQPTRRTGLVLFGFIAWLGTAALACGPFLPHRIPPDSDHDAMTPVVSIRQASDKAGQAGVNANSASAAPAAGGDQISSSDDDRRVAQYRQP